MQMTEAVDVKEKKRSRGDRGGDQGDSTLQMAHSCGQAMYRERKEKETRRERQAVSIKT